MRTPTDKSIRVLVVDDSSLVRTMLARELSAARDVEVVGFAGDPYEARQRILELEPDVVTLDLEMPRMDGLTFLRRLMRHHPIPVVVVSSLTAQGSVLAAESLDTGAMSVICKPGAALSAGEFAEELIAAVRAAAVAHPRSGEPQGSAVAMPGRAKEGALIAVGASIGGPQALQTVLSGMPSDAPPMVVVQHMPATFTAAFAACLNVSAAVGVMEARDGDRLVPGKALVAPGDNHITVMRDASGLFVSVRPGPLVSSHRPSIDVMMKSVARVAGSSAVGVLMTGMGHDGANGLRCLREAGAATIVQDEATSVVFGMAKEALQLEPGHEVAPLGCIAFRALAGAVEAPTRV